MKSPFVHLALCLALAGAPLATAQEYTQTPVTVSTEKVRSGGKVYYSHIVQERQTLFSIARAYGVTVDDICAANPEQNLREEGPRVHSIILIPAAPSRSEEAVSSDPKAPADTAKANPGYFIHTVKWYEDIDDIADKYGISADFILRYNGLTSRKLKSRMQLRIPVEENEALLSGADEPGEGKSPVPADAPDTLQAPPALEDYLSVFKKKDKVSALLVMPFGATGLKQSDNAMDFYSGVLLGVRDLGRKGVNIDLSVCDIQGGNVPVTTADIARADLVIGPVTPSDLGKVLAIDTTSTPVVSPLDPKVLDMVSDHKNLLHAPTPQDIQYEDAVAWIASDMAADDKVIVISERGERNADTVAMLDSLLRSRGVDFMHFDYNLLSGRKVADELAKSMTAGTNRVIVTSDSEAFVHDVVRNLGLLQRKNRVVLYGVSKIRTFSTIEVENLHKLNLHMATSYFIDYDDPRVRDFVLAYRALFGSDPTQFAFQGYDLATFFISKCQEGGPNWKRRLGAIERESALQADFLMSEVEEGGMMNTAVRRVVYTPDYKVIPAGR